MNTKKYIEFKKKRELGEILTDTFAFLRANGKPLLSVLIKTVGIPFILLLAAFAYYTYSSSTVMDPFAINNGDVSNIGNFFISFCLLIVIGSVTSGLMFGSVSHYIREYIESNGSVDKDTVFQAIKNDTGSIILLSLLVFLIYFGGFVLCVIPVIYLYVPMSVVFSIYVFTPYSITESISQSFNLIKNEWWMTFATLFILAIVVGLIGFVFSIPAFIYTFVKTFTAASEGSLTNPSDLFDWVYIALNTFSSAAQFVLYIITAVATVFIYFNLNERKHATGTLEQIDSLGNKE